MFAIIGVTAGTARADIVVIQGVETSGTVNVALNPGTDVLTATGVVGGLVVNFTSNSGSQLLTTVPSGQARVIGGTGNTALTRLTFGLSSGTFTKAAFDINAAADGDVLIHVEGVNIDGGFFEDDFFVADSGANPFTVEAINGQLIESIKLIGLGIALEDVRQIRMGGGRVPVPVGVPEPASMVLLGTGLIGLVAGLRKRVRA